jgi:membrane protease YdiL (CAAX protease family)
VCTGCGTSDFVAEVRKTDKPARTTGETRPVAKSVEGGEVRWRSRNAWQCALALILLNFVLLSFTRFGMRHSRGFASWWGHTPLALAVSVAMQGGLFLVVTFYFSEAPSVRDFVERSALARRPTFMGWGLVWVAIGIGLADLYGMARGLTSASGASSRGYYFSLTGAAFSFSILKSILIVPVYEEIVFRGFLYRAFRGTYGAIPSTGIIVCLSAYFHWEAVSHSLFTTACLVSLWILLCFVRERTGSSWDCILSHEAYNAVVSRHWLLCMLGLVLAGALCAPTIRSAWRAWGEKSRAHGG